MITCVEAKNFRCLRYIRQPLGEFHVLAGPNGSGKSTFLDAIAFLGDLVSCGLREAMTFRTSHFPDLLWNRAGRGFEIAVEARIPDGLRHCLADIGFDGVRYEVAIAFESEAKGVIEAERVLLKKSSKDEPKQTQGDFFPIWHEPPESVLTKGPKGTMRTIINKVAGGNDHFYPEVFPEKGRDWSPAFKFGRQRSALGNLPEDREKFPVSSWLKSLLSEGLRIIDLNRARAAMGETGIPGRHCGVGDAESFLAGGVEKLQGAAPQHFHDWLMCLQQILPGLENISTSEQGADGVRHLKLHYRGGLEVPLGMVSHGTLRFLTLSMPAYLLDFGGVYMIEEPENGLHPGVIVTLLRSLASMNHAQVLLTTHSPIILHAADPGRVLCFVKTPEGTKEIISGSDHPRLRAWREETRGDDLTAGGVLE